MVIVLFNNNNTGLEIIIAENHFDMSDLNVIVHSF